MVFIYSYSERGCRKVVHATIPKGNMGYNQYTAPDTVAVELTAIVNILSWPLMSFFQTSLRTVNSKPPTTNTFQDLSRALFPTTFLEIALYLHEIKIL